MKKILILFFTLLIMLSSMFTSVIAESKTTFSVKDAVGAVGETVEVPLAISNNAGIWGFRIHVDFNTDVLSVKEIKNSGNIFYNGEFTIGPNDFSKGTIIICVFSNDIHNNNTKNGTFCSIVFNVKDNAPLGKYPIKVRVDSGDVCNVKQAPVSADSKNGNIEIKKSVPKKPTNKNDNNENNILAKADNNKLVTNSVNDNNLTNDRTEIRTNYEYDDNNNIVTDKNGEKKTITERVGIIDETSATSKSNTSNNATDNDGLSSTTIIFIIVISLIAAAVIVLLIIKLSIKKNKKK